MDHVRRLATCRQRDNHRSLAQYPIPAACMWVLMQRQGFRAEPFGYSRQLITYDGATRSRDTSTDSTASLQCHGGGARNDCRPDRRRICLTDIPCCFEQTNRPPRRWSCRRRIRRSSTIRQTRAGDSGPCGELQHVLYSPTLRWEGTHREGRRGERRPIHIHPPLPPDTPAPDSLLPTPGQSVSGDPAKELPYVGSLGAPRVYRLCDWCETQCA